MSAAGADGLLGLPWWLLAVLVVTVVAASAVQGVVGLGLGLISAPVVTLLRPDLMPVVPLVLAAVLPLVTLVGEHEQIDWRGLGWALTARVPGTWLGVLALGVISTRVLGIVVGLMVLAAVLLSLGSITAPVRRGTLLAAGLVSGVTGTTTSIGGPPLALLYQRRPPVQVRTTLAVYFVAGAAFSLLGLAVAGDLRTQPVLVALLLTPCLALGAWLATWLRRSVPDRLFRPAVLAVCAASALLLLVRSLVT